MSWLAIDSCRRTPGGLVYEVHARRWHPAFWAVCWSIVRNIRDGRDRPLPFFLAVWLCLGAIVRGLR